MDLHEIHTWINFVIDKEQAGWFSPEEIDRALDRAQMFVFDQRRQRYALNQQDQDALAPFKVTFEFTNSNTPNGIVTFPQNYESLLSIHRISTEDGVPLLNGIDIINDDEITDRLKNQLRPVSEADPVGQWYGRGQIQLWPRVPSAGLVSYLRRPDRPSYSYAVVSDVIVYNELQSTQMEWDDVNIELIMVKALEYLGINLDNEKLVQYAKS